MYPLKNSPTNHKENYKKKQALSPVYNYSVIFLNVFTNGGFSILLCFTTWLAITFVLLKIVYKNLTFTNKVILNLLKYAFFEYKKE